MLVNRTIPPRMVARHPEHLSPIVLPFRVGLPSPTNVMGSPPSRRIRQGQVSPYNDVVGSTRQFKEDLVGLPVLRPGRSVNARQSRDTRQFKDVVGPDIYGQRATSTSCQPSSCVVSALASRLSLVHEIPASACHCQPKRSPSSCGIPCHF